MCKHLLCILIITVIGGCGGAKREALSVAQAPATGKSIVAVGDAWDDAVRKLNESGAKQNVPLALGWMTAEERRDMFLGVPKLPTRRVWLLSNGYTVKLWGDDPFGSGHRMPKRVARIEQVKINTEDGIVSQSAKVHEMQRVQLGRQSDGR